MTLESALPYLSIGCAVGAGAAAAGRSPRVERALKTGALLALALFAFLRGIGPAALAMALVLSGLSTAASPRDRTAPALLPAALSILAWLVLAWLCLRDGVGLAVAGEPLRLGLTLAAVAGCAALGAWIWRGPEPAQTRATWAGETGALTLLLLSALTLRDSQWAAVAGGAGLLAALSLSVASARRPGAARPAEILCWALSYVSQAAMAYVFLR